MDGGCLALINAVEKLVGRRQMLEMREAGQEVRELPSLQDIYLAIVDNQRMDQRELAETRTA